MNSDLAKPATSPEIQLTREQIEIVKQTVAKNASDDELKLFLYRCKAMGLDPLKPGQIHFVKYGSGPGTIIIGIEGFRNKAAMTGKHSGTKRGVTRDANGKCLGAWCEVYRSDWKEPAREEVALSEYNTGKAQWLKMPETMIKKVAEVAALRIAFPDALGGLYSHEEMEQAAEPLVETISTPATPVVVESSFAKGPDSFPFEKDESLGGYVIPIGKNKGKCLKDVPPENLAKLVLYLQDSEFDSGNPMGQRAEELCRKVYEFFKEQGYSDTNRSLK